MNQPQSNPPVWKKKWVQVTGVGIAGVVAITVEITTGVIGIVNFTTKHFFPPPPIQVLVTPESAPNRPACLKFSFERVPSDFTLGKIRFKVTTVLLLDSLIAAPEPGFRRGPKVTAKRPHEPRKKDMVVPVDVINGKAKFVDHNVMIQAEKENDAFTVPVCAVLMSGSTSITMTVVPSFFSLTMKPIENIEVRTADNLPVEKGIQLKVTPRRTVSNPSLRTR